MEQTHIAKKDVGHFLRRRYNSTIMLMLGLLLFLLPFARIKCGSVKIAENTGIGMVTGQQWKVSFGDMDKEFFGDMDDVTGSSIKNGRPQWFVILAAFFAVCGLVVSLSYWELRPLLTMCAAILAAVLLGGAYFHLKMQLRSLPFDDAYDGAGFGGMGFIKLKFTIWYFLSLLSFLAAAFFSYTNHRLELEDRLAATTLFDFQKEKETPSETVEPEGV